MKKEIKGVPQEIYQNSSSITGGKATNEEHNVLERENQEDKRTKIENNE